MRRCVKLTTCQFLDYVCCVFNIIYRCCHVIPYKTIAVHGEPLDSAMSVCARDGYRCSENLYEISDFDHQINKVT